MAGRWESMTKTPGRRVTLLVYRIETVKGLAEQSFSQQVNSSDFVDFGSPCDVFKDGDDLRVAVVDMRTFIRQFSMIKGIRSFFCCSKNDAILELLLDIWEMASMFVFTDGGDGGDKEHNHHSPHHKEVSPGNSFKKTWPTNPSTPPSPSSPPPSCGHGSPRQPGEALPKCVCAPATHPGSFKCRLHRVNSRGHSAPPAPPASAPESSTRTVEAQ
ncbi:hypothetical protein Taro_023697 [Colocasia esculenta]|uniref:Uncharacterized protein n=1 Tax=Colocasia esculenta TaxID=4460 RepID=A0A843VI38_COLES|nr:hypothetical protein [Colocasia esculenta]